MLCDKDQPTNRYVVTLDPCEREHLAEIIRRGLHASQKVINALILLHYDAGEFNAQLNTGETTAGVLQISQRKVDRVKLWSDNQHYSEF